MAHYDDDDGYIWPHEEQKNNNFDLFVAYNQNSVSYNISADQSYYALDTNYDPRFLDYYHFSNDYDYGHNSVPEINYFAHNYVEQPKFYMYQPDTGNVSYHTQYSISYPKEIDSGFNEPEFEEYDPTPYGGGYDILSVYGKPLPPSDSTCYPHSNRPKPNDPKPVHKPTLTSIAAPSPIVEPMHEPQNKPEPKSGPEQPVQVPVVMDSPRPLPIAAPFVDPAASLQLTEAAERETEDYTYPDHTYDYSWPEYDNGYGTGVGYDYGYGKQIVKIPPYEYNSEVVDLCENIFGSWPCLARIREQQMRNNPVVTCPQNVHRSPWEDCVNYFFGGPNPSYNQ